MKPRISEKGKKVLTNPKLARYVMLHREKFRTLLMKDKLLKNN